MPKITKTQGPSYSSDDPRHVPTQRDGEQGPVVPHGDHREVEADGGAINRAATEERVGEPETAQQLGGLEEVQSVGDDREETEERPRPDYGKWTKAELNEELDRRKIEHDSKANNAVLIELLERSDGGETLTGVND